MGSVAPPGGSHAPTRRRQQQTVEIEKDDIELRLEKALFGDDAGFLDSISAARYGEGKELQLYSSDSDNGDVNDEDLDLGDVADEDVSFANSRKCFEPELTCYSYFFWMQALELYPSQRLTSQLRQSLRNTLLDRVLCGMIAMTTASLFR